MRVTRRTAAKRRAARAQIPQNPPVETPTKKQKMQKALPLIINPTDPDLVRLSTCSLCSERYNSHTHVPITLICGHSICKACLPRYTEYGDIYVCTVCDELSIIGEDHCWTKNLIVHRLLERLQLLDDTRIKPRRKLLPIYNDLPAKLLQLVKHEAVSIQRFMRAMQKFLKDVVKIRLMLISEGSLAISALKGALDSMEVFVANVTDKLSTYSSKEEAKEVSEVVMDVVEIQNDDQELKDLTQCCVCFEAYNKTIYAPISVSCGHTFCRRCVNHVLEEGIFKCCMCRRDTVAAMYTLCEDKLAIDLLKKLDLLSKDSGDENQNSAPETPIPKPDQFILERVIEAAAYKIFRNSTQLLSLMTRVDTDFPGFHDAYVRITNMKGVLQTFLKKLHEVNPFNPVAYDEAVAANRQPQHRFRPPPPRQAPVRMTEST